MHFHSGQPWLLHSLHHNPDPVQDIGSLELPLVVKVYHPQDKARTNGRHQASLIANQETLQ
jgi:hypothetical protein